MSRTLIGCLLLLAGVAYGSMAIDSFYNHTLGWLVANGWISQEKIKKSGKPLLGRKPTILIYSFSLIIIGVFILWNRNN